MSDVAERFGVSRQTVTERGANDTKTRVSTDLLIRRDDPMRARTLSNPTSKLSSAGCDDITVDGAHAASSSSSGEKSETEPHRATVHRTLVCND